MKELEKAAKRYRKTTPNQMYGDELGFIEGAKWAQERRYTEEDLFDCWKASSTADISDDSLRVHFQEWFKKFKKK